MSNIFFVLVFMVGTFATGSFFLRKSGFSFNGNLERISFSAATGVGILVLATFLLGVAGLYYKVTAILLLFLPPIVFYRETISLFEILISFFMRLPALLNNRTTRFFTIGIIAILVLCGITCFLPVTVSDALRYHLTVPQQYICHHSIVNLTITESNFNLNAAMAFLLALFMGTETLASFFHFSMAVLVVFSVVSFTSRYVNGSAGLLAGLLLCTQPLYPWTAGTTADTFFQMAFLFTAVYAFFVWEECDETRWLVLSAVLCGFALGTKNTSVATMGGLELLLAFDILFRKRKGIGAFITSSAVFWGVAFIVTAPWLIKNLIFTGNPFFPLFPELIPTRNLSPFFRNYTSIFGGSGFGEFLSYFWIMTTESYPYRGGTISPAILGFLPAVLFAGRTNRYISRLFVLAIILYPLHWGLKIRVDRYFFIVLILLTIVIACALYEIMKRGGWRKFAISAMLFLTFGYSASIFCTGNENILAAVRIAAGNQQLAEQFRTEKNPCTGTLRYASANIDLPEGRQFIVGQHFTHHLSYLEAPLVLTAYYFQGYFDYATLDSPEAIYEKLMEQKGAYLLYGDEEADTGSCEEDPQSPDCYWALMIEKYSEQVYSDGKCKIGKLEIE